MTAKLRNITWTCACCGKAQNRLPALAFATPGNLPPMPAWRRLRLGGRASDLYILGKGGGQFIHCVLRIPIVDADEHLEWGVWCSLSAANFARYRKSYGSKTQSSLGPMFGWFSSSCPGYPETLHLKSMVHPCDDNMRPLVELDATDHPLSIDQRNGITSARALELAEPFLKMMRH